jgi:hypothetical protein
MKKNKLKLCTHGFPLFQSCPMCKREMVKPPDMKKNKDSKIVENTINYYVIKPIESSLKKRLREKTLKLETWDSLHTIAKLSDTGRFLLRTDILKLIEEI